MCFYLCIYIHIYMFIVYKKWHKNVYLMLFTAVYTKLRAVIYIYVLMSVDHNMHAMICV